MCFQGESNHTCAALPAFILVTSQVGCYALYQTDQINMIIMATPKISFIQKIYVVLVSLFLTGYIYAQKMVHKGHKILHNVLLLILFTYFSNMKTGGQTSLTASSLPARIVL